MFVRFFLVGLRGFQVRQDRLGVQRQRAGVRDALGAGGHGQRPDPARLPHRPAARLLAVDGRPGRLPLPLRCGPPFCHSFYLT